MSEFTLTVNGERLHVNADPEEPLLSVLRDHLELTGTKYGCGEGQCGACTVLIDGQAMRSCQLQVSTLAAAHVTTIEGLQKQDKLTAVQQAFLDQGAMQCGYCTSGMILAATALLNQTPHPSDQQIVDVMNHNICRCGTYPRILEAVRRASRIAGHGGGR